MALVIDRFEGEFAIVERDNCEFIRLPRASLPQSAREGDTLCEDGRGASYVDLCATKERRAAARQRLNRLFTK